ncbi:MAG: GDSL-type esterase/lipase family protein [Leptolyngbyaceae cyanobacterium bins.302]|nr:GDSL-type esterase/lipase family protein [Leptolyngbyaceae cyanobacterium bins.302]
MFAFPKWILLPGVASGALLLTALLFSQRDHLTASSKVNASTVSALTINVPLLDSKIEPSIAMEAEVPAVSLEPQELGPRHELTYHQWVNLLAREAAAIAHKPPEHLYVLAGDSLSLWFPTDLLPTGVTWLNQGISGETSYGLLRRVKLFDQTKPKVIFVMIGINDLIRGMRYETVAANHREIVRHLRAAHPQATIVMQSILPHGGKRASQRYFASVKGDPAPEQNPLPLWVKRLPVITNPSIRRLNQRLALIAQEEKVQFLDLHTQFTDTQGDLRDELSTDGLHLSAAGYTLWRSHLEPFLPAAQTAASQR